MLRRKLNRGHFGDEGLRTHSHQISTARKEPTTTLKVAPYLLHTLADQAFRLQESSIVTNSWSQETKAGLSDASVAELLGL